MGLSGKCQIKHSIEIKLAVLRDFIKHHTKTEIIIGFMIEIFAIFGVKALLQSCFKEENCTNIYRNATFREVFVVLNELLV